MFKLHRHSSDDDSDMLENRSNSGLLNDSFDKGLDSSGDIQFTQKKSKGQTISNGLSSSYQDERAGDLHNKDPGHKRNHNNLVSNMLTGGLNTNAECDKGDYLYLEGVIIKVKEECDSNYQLSDYIEAILDAFRLETNEEWEALIAESKELSKTMKKIIEISIFLLDKVRASQTESEELAGLNNNLLRELQIKNDQQQNTEDEVRSLILRDSNQQEVIKSHERTIAILNDQIQHQLGVIQKIQVDDNSGSQQSRTSFGRHSAIIAEQQTEYENQLTQMRKRIQEMEEMLLNKSSIYHDEENRNHLLKTQVKKFKEDGEGLKDNVEQMRALIELRDNKILEVEAETKRLQEELIQSQVQLKRLDRRQQLKLTNPMSKTQLELAKNKNNPSKDDQIPEMDGEIGAGQSILKNRLVKFSLNQKNYSDQLDKAMEQVSRSINLRAINTQKSINDFQRSLQMNPALSQMVQSGKFMAGSKRFANMAPQYMSQVLKPRDTSKADINFNSKHGQNLNLPELGSVDEDEDVVKMESRGGSRIKEKGLGLNDSAFIDYQPKNNENEEERASITNFSEIDPTQRVNESLQSMQLQRPLQSGLPHAKEDSPIKTIQQILDSPKRLSAYKSSLPLSNNRPFEAISEESRESKDRPDKKNEFKIQVALADPTSNRSYLPNTNTESDSYRLWKLGQGNIHERKEAEEEYFHLAVISYLLQHQKRGYLFNVDKGKLFRQARSQNIAFTEWPKWIERQMINIHNEKQRKKKAQRQP